MNIRSLGIELPSGGIEKMDTEPFMVEGQVVGAIHWLPTTDSRIRAGIWSVECSETDRPATFTGHETFQVFNGCAEIVIDGLSAMTVGPGDVGSIDEGIASHWYVAAPFTKLFVLGGSRSAAETPAT